MRILIVEDERQLREAIARYLRSQGHAADEANSCREAQVSTQIHQYDVVILDRILPDGDSLHLVEKWRRSDFQVPIIFLTARDAVADRVDGLESGADDYLVKPFAMEELLARIISIARRNVHPVPTIVRAGNLEVNVARREATRDGILIPLRPKEFTLLELLISRKGQVVSREKIVNTCWDTAKEPMSNVEESLVASLRRKLGKPSLIQTIRGSGYMLEEA